MKRKSNALSNQTMKWLETSLAHCDDFPFLPLTRNPTSKNLFLPSFATVAFLYQKKKYFYSIVSFLFKARRKRDSGRCEWRILSFTTIELYIPDSDVEMSFDNNFFVFIEERTSHYLRRCDQLAHIIVAFARPILSSRLIIIIRNFFVDICLHSTGGHFGFCHDADFHIALIAISSTQPSTEV